MAKNEAKVKFNADVAGFNDSIKESERTMAELRAEMRLNETQMKGAEDSTEGLEKKQDILERQLKASEEKTEALNQKLKVAVDIFGENSEEASRLRIQLMNAENAQEKLRQSVNGCNDEMKGSKDAAESAGDGFTIMKGAIADLVSSGIQWGIEKISEFVGYLASLPAETMELRQDLSTLTTAFDNMSFSNETATETWKDMYAIFGEDDRAVEASNLIAKMSDDQQDLSDWTTITTGVWADYQDSLPVEGLAEASNETAKVGKVTGVLADALNWSSEAANMFADYMSEDVVTAEDAFNEALKECTTEQERQSLITETLKNLYGESANTYRETAEGQMTAKEAAAELMLAESELAETVEPVTTEFTILKTELLEGMQPAMETISGIMTDALEWMREHPTAMQAVSAAVGVLAVGFTGLAVALGVYTFAQWAMNTAILANPITWIVVGIIAAIAALVAIGVVLYKNWDKIKAKAKEVWSNVTAKFNEAKEKVTGIVENIKTGVTTKFESIKQGAIDKFNALKNGIINPIQTARDKVKGIVEKIKGIFNFDWSIPKPKIPKFSVSGGKAPWGFGGKGKLPSVDVKWNALGAVVTKPTLVGSVGDTIMGAGEAGAEAILPIAVLQDYINRAFDRNVYAYAAAGGGGEVYNFYVNDATINDDAQMRDVAKDFITEMVRLGGMNR